MNARGMGTFKEIHGESGHHEIHPGMLVWPMCRARQKVLCGNTAGVIGDTPGFVRPRHTGKCHNADPADGTGGAAAPGTPLLEGEVIGHQAADRRSPFLNCENL